MRKLESFPFFLYLLPIFFYLVAITNYGLHPTTTYLVLPFVLMLIIISLGHLFIHKKKIQHKRLYIIFFLWALFYLFFGNIKEAIPTTNFFYSYYILFPLVCMMPLIIGYLLKRNLNNGQTIFTYLNWLMMILTTMQIGFASKNIKASQGVFMKSIELPSSQIKSKPNIYFILFDEYPGQISLQHYYQFNNEKLVNHLRQNDYYVFDTINSNYDKTVYSVNSTLNLQYVDSTIYKPVKDYSAYLKNYVSIRKNLVSNFLKKEGYSIHNLSLFSIDNHESNYAFPMLYTNNRNLYRNTLLEKLKRDLLWKLYCGRFRMESMYNKYLLHTHHQNNEIIQKTIETSEKNDGKPFFHFAHLLMPHEPLFTDSLGNLYDMEKETHTSDTSIKALAYLKYTNTRMMQLSDSLVKNDPQAIIILLSDHGYRDTPEENRKYYCNNFMAIHLPDSNYAQISKIGSNVNLFRVIFNQYFNMQLPLLKNESYSIDEEKDKFSLLENRQ